MSWKNLLERCSRNKTAVFSCAAVLVLGIVVRFWGLAWHYTHTDDLGIIESIFFGQAQHNIFYLSTALSNAPFQYLFTYFLISPAMDYRDLLFWARLPSCVAGCSALFLMIAFYLQYNAKSWGKCFLALTLMAVSWDNIVFARQAHSYAISVLAATIFLFVVMKLLKPGFSGLTAIALAAILALACSMQYQVLLFVPAVYLTLFLYHFKGAEKKRRVFVNFILSGLFFAVLIFPLWYFFLRGNFNDFPKVAHQWAFGSHREYALDPALFRNLAANGWGIVGFYVRNLGVILEAKTGFFAETHPCFKFASVALSLSFILGSVNFLISPERKTRFLGLFLGLVLLTWWVMVPLKQLPYGPTRHTLILLPLFAVTIAEGVEGLFSLAGNFTKKVFSVMLQNSILWGAGVMILGIFLLNYGVFLAERKDPVNEKEIVKVLEAFGVEEFFYDKRGFHLEYIRAFRALHEKLMAKQVTEIQTFAFFTRYPAASVFSRCEKYQAANRMIELMAKKEATSMPPLRVFRRPCRDFQVVYEKKLESDVSEGFSNKLRSDILANRMYFYVLSVDPEKKKISEQFKKSL